VGRGLRGKGWGKEKNRGMMEAQKVYDENQM